MKTRTIKRTGGDGHIDYLVQYKGWFFWNMMQVFDINISPLQRDATFATEQDAREAETVFINSKIKPVIEVLD